MNEEITKKIEALDIRITNLEKHFSVSETSTISETSTKQISVKEYLLSKKVSGGVEKTLLIAYYVEKFMQITPFNVEDLEKAFRSGKEQVPENINDKINKNINKGYLMDSINKKDSKKTWELTATGEKYIEALNQPKKND